MSNKFTCSFPEFKFPNLPLIVKGIEVKNCSVKYAVSLQIIVLTNLGVSRSDFFFSQTRLQQQQRQNQSSRAAV